MEKLVKKYADKLVAQGLCDAGAPIMGGLDAKLTWNKKDPACRVLEEAIAGLDINSILFARPSEPYFSILNYLGKNSCGDDFSIQPDDTETRTFLHDIPVSRTFAKSQIIRALKKRKSVVIPDHGIVTFGTVSPEQAFVTYSSVCFSLFVKFFTDYLYAVGNGTVKTDQERVFGRALKSYKNSYKPSYKHSGNSNRNFQSHDRDHDIHRKLKKGPFKTKNEVIDAIVQAGKLTVEHRLVDSFFGNISYRLYSPRDTLYISQTGSSLDMLSGCIDACPMDGSSCVGITASSEFSAHKDIYLRTKSRAILHGHPKFCVIMSMFCENSRCDFRGSCHIKCPEKRFVGDVPIVPGEVGTGRYGLCHTLPPAIKGNRGVIVYGHGLFTVGKCDFTDAFYNMAEIEEMCFERYMDKINK